MHTTVYLPGLLLICAYLTLMEQLIRDLNAPGNQGDPQKIDHIQRQVQQLQRDPSAWDLGLSLLNHADDIMRFYGALTISIKVNSDWQVSHARIIGSIANMLVGRRTRLVKTEL